MHRGVGGRVGHADVLRTAPGRQGGDHGGSEAKQENAESPTHSAADHNRIAILTRAPRTPRALLAAALPLLVGLLTGCGSTTHVGPTGIVSVGLSEYRVSPQQISSRTGALTILVHNYGRLNHNLVIFYDGVNEASTQPIRPGQSAELIANLTPGTYTIASTVLADQALGAYGSLTVSR